MLIAFKTIILYLFIKIYVHEFIFICQQLNFNEFEISIRNKYEDKKDIIQSLQI